MNDHEKNSALCGHLLVAWALGLNAAAMFSCPASFRLTHLFGVLAAAFALACAWVLSAMYSAAQAGDLDAGSAEMPARWMLVACIAFTLLSWLALVVGVISRG